MRLDIIIIAKLRILTLLNTLGIKARRRQNRVLKSIERDLENSDKNSDKQCPKNRKFI